MATSKNPNGNSSIYFDTSMCLADLDIELSEFSSILVCIANSSVADCASNPVRSTEVNLGFPLRIAHEAAMSNLKVILFSSEYVFDGRSREAYTEASTTCPTSIYGLQKQAIENFYPYIHDNVLLFRISKLASLDDDRSFLARMWREIATRNPYDAAVDQVFTPIDTKTASRIILKNCESDLIGLYNLCGASSISRYQLACNINKHLGNTCSINPVVLADMEFSYNIPPDLSMSSAKIRDAMNLLDWTPTFSEGLCYHHS